MRKLSDDELEVLQRLIVNEGWMPMSERVMTEYYRASYHINGCYYIIVNFGDGVEGWEVG